MIHEASFCRLCRLSVYFTYAVGRSVIDSGDGLLMEESGSSEVRTRIGTVTFQTAAAVLYLLTAILVLCI